MTVSRVNTGISTRLDPNNQLQTPTQTAQTPTVGEQVTQALFARAKPPVVDPAHFPQLAEALRLLHKWRKKLAIMAGDEEDDYDVVLADAVTAAIDEDGVVYFGATFLAAYRLEPDVLAGVLAHEIGHRPKRWKHYRQRRALTQTQLETLCRHEETRADIFAGKALAELGLSWEPIAELLERLETGPHPTYLPAAVRGEVIRDAHTGRSYRVENRRKYFPGFDRMTSPKGHLGEY